MTNKVALIIMDGWGIGKKDFTDAVAASKTPFIDSLQAYPHAEMAACGEAVGLPEGQMGNSEVGHLNLGAGRVVYQELVRINKSIAEGEMFGSEVWLNAINYAQTNQKKIHLLGLLSDGGVHSSMAHLLGIAAELAAKKIPNVYIHAFSDGRDTDPKSGLGFVQELMQNIDGKYVKLASLCGRYYAMDRDKRWERIKIAYDLLVNGVGEVSKNAESAVKKSYENGVTDEFIMPILLEKSGLITEGDVVLFFNFRTDRGRELTEVLSQTDMHELNMHKLGLHYVTMTNYNQSYKNIAVLFSKDNLENTLGETIAKANKTQLRAAETEKYPHVTFFFSGGREAPYEGEMRVMASSPKVATYDMQPEMSALELTQGILDAMETKSPDFLCINFANPDMVGHTGVFGAIVTACETVDACVQRICEQALAQGYTVLVTADHGNADQARNDDGTPNTAHSLNQVPLFLVGNNVQNYQLRNGKLANIAPTILELMGIAKPDEMTAQSLLVLK